jgi:putative oxidoreductase
MHLFLSNARCLEFGLTCIRIATGLIFMVHGWGKLTGGIPTWTWLGSQMAHFGITFLPVFWGFLAMLAELGGGLCLALGFCTRIAAAALIFTMLVAISYHLSNGDNFNDRWSHPFTLLLIFIGLFIAGPGSYSLDYYFFGR